MNKKTVKNIESPAKPVEKPSLYTSFKKTVGATKSLSILDILEREPSQAANRRWIVLGLMAAAVLLAVFYSIMNTAAQQDSFQLPGWLGSEQGKKATPESTVVLETPVSSMVASVDTQEIAATITNEVSVEKEDVASTDKQIVDQQGGQGGVLMSSADKSKNEQRNHMSALQSAGNSQLGKEVKSQQTTAVASSRKEKSNSQKTETKPAAELASGSKGKGSNKDGDVELIAALLSRVSRSDTGAKDVAPKSANVPPKAQIQSTGTALKKREQHDDLNRDVIVRAPGETTEVLIARCRSLGFLEGELCRLRICSGEWGSDSACSGNSQLSAN